MEYLGSERILYGEIEGMDVQDASHRQAAACARRQRKHPAGRVARFRGAQ